MHKLRYFLFFFLLAQFACTPKFIKNYEKQFLEAPKSQAEKDKNTILKHAIENKLDMQMTDSGIFYIIEKEGTGTTHPDMQSDITAHYRGTLMDGTKFDASYDRDEPLEFKLGQVVKGWQKAIPLLTKGAKGKFFIPSGLAYGKRGGGDVIPPNSVLIFEIELLDFK